MIGQGVVNGLTRLPFDGVFAIGAVAAVTGEAKLFGAAWTISTQGVDYVNG
jgi:hypothetical protein